MGNTGNHVQSGEKKHIANTQPSQKKSRCVKDQRRAKKCAPPKQARSLRVIK